MIRDKVQKEYLEPKHETFCLFRSMIVRLKQLVNLVDCFIRTQAQESQGKAFAKNGDQKEIGKDLVEMDALFLTLVKQEGKFLFSENGGHFAYRSEIASGQGGKGIDVVLEPAVVLTGYDVSGHINEESAVHPDIHEVLLQDLLDTFQLSLAQRIGICHAASTLPRGCGGRLFGARRPGFSVPAFNWFAYPATFRI